MTTLLSERVTYERLPHGIDVFLAPTATKDVVVCKMSFPGGTHAVYDRQVVAMLLSELLPGGTKKMKRSTVLERLDALGAHVSIQTDNEHLLVSLAARTTVFEEALRLVMEVLCTPTFRMSEYVEAVSHVRTVLGHSEEDTRLQARVSLMQMLYKRGHPHWEAGSRKIEKELRTVERGDIAAFHRNTFSAVGALVVVAGDITPRRLMDTMRSVLAQVPREHPKRISSVHINRTVSVRAKDTIVSLKDKMNIDTMLGIPLAITHDHEDFHALGLGVQVLGGSASARLFTVLRNQKSLTYGAYGSLAGFGDGYPGYLSTLAIFPSDVFAGARSIFREVVEGWAHGDVTAHELLKRKEELAGKYKVGLATTAGICNSVFTVLSSGRPVSYIDEYPARIESLTRREVNGAIKEHVNYDLAATAAAGAIDREGKPLK